MPRRLNRPCPFNPPTSRASRASSEADRVRVPGTRVFRIDQFDASGNKIGYRYEARQVVLDVSWAEMRANAASMQEAYDSLPKTERDAHKFQGGERWDKPKPEGEKR